jgi:hypothetical protein
MPLVRFELTIPAFERTKTVYALDRRVTVIGIKDIAFRTTKQFTSIFFKKILKIFCKLIIIYRLNHRLNGFKSNIIANKRYGACSVYAHMHTR